MAASNPAPFDLAKLEAVVPHLAAADAMLAGRRRTPLDGALLAVAAAALEEELEAELAVYKDSSAETLEDDLSQISGLTEECEQKLKSEGIKTYYSLALLKANEVDQLEP